MIQASISRCVHHHARARTAVCGAITWAMACAVQGANVVVTTIDGSRVEGVFLGIDSTKGVQVRSNETDRSFSLDDLAEMVFETNGSYAGFSSEIAFADGSHLPGEIVGEAPDGIACRLGLGNDIILSFDHLAGVRLADPREYPLAAKLYDNAMVDRRPGQDVLIARSTEAARAVPGRLLEIDESRGAMQVDDQLRTFRLEKVYGIVFAAGGQPPSRVPVTVHLSDGSTLAIASVTGNSDALKIVAAAGFAAQLPVARISRLSFHSDRVQYLSDLPTASESVSGMLYGSWPVRRDRSVSGGPLQLNGRQYEKGLGVHSRTELVYELNGAFDTFAAVIGIDDHVRPRGSCIFRVLGDGQVLYDSGDRTGADEAIFARVDIRGVRLLSLVAEYGADLDLSDHADWADAKLIRAAGQSQ